MALRGSWAWLLALAVVCAMMRHCCADSASETAEAVAEEKSDTLLVLGLTAAAVVVLVLLCAIWKLCCGKKAVADTYRNKEDPNQETELEHFTRRHPPALLAPDPRRIKWKTGVQMLLHIDVANNPPTFTGMVASPTGANANLRTLASSAGMAHEHALLFGLENPHAQTTEKSTHGGKRTEQYLLHPVMTFQADRPLHPPTLQLHTDVYCTCLVLSWSQRAASDSPCVVQTKLPSTISTKLCPGALSVRMLEDHMSRLSAGAM